MNEPPLISPEVRVVCGAGFILGASVYGGLTVSTFLATGQLPDYLPPMHIVGVLATAPGDPASVWPSTPGPGPAWLVWSSMAVCGVLALLLCAVVVMWRPRRRRSERGFATPTDLREHHLDSRGARKKSKDDYPRKGHRRWRL